MTTIDPRYPEAPAWIDYAVRQYQGGILVDTNAPDCGIHPDAMRAALTIMFDPRWAPALAGPAFVEQIARAVATAEAHYEHGATPDQAMATVSGHPIEDSKLSLACAKYFRARGMWDEGENYRSKNDRANGTNLHPLRTT